MFIKESSGHNGDSFKKEYFQKHMFRKDLSLVSIRPCSVSSFGEAQQWKLKQKYVVTYPEYLLLFSRIIVQDRQDHPFRNPYCCEVKERQEICQVFRFSSYILRDLLSFLQFKIFSDNTCMYVACLQVDLWYFGLQYS